MKIWIAELKLRLNSEEEFECEFSYKQSDEDYEFEEKTKDYVYYKDWYYYRVPTLPTVSFVGYGTCKVTQGFDRELKVDELLATKEQLKRMLIEKLESDLECEIINYTHKIEAVRLWEV